MTELSYFWGGTTVGHAQEAPYSDDEFSDFLAMLLTNDRTKQGVVGSNYAGYSGNLEVTNPASTNLSVATGIALVDGKLYKNSAAVAVGSASSAGQYYRVVLHKDFIAQTVTLLMLGPSGGIPALTQNDVTVFEIPLATVLNTAGVLTITDERRWVNTPATKWMFINPSAGWNDTGAAALVWNHTYTVPGFDTEKTFDSTIISHLFRIPDDYLGNLHAYTLLSPSNDTGWVGRMSFLSHFRKSGINASYGTTIAAADITMSPTVFILQHHDWGDISVAGTGEIIAPGDWGVFRFERKGLHANDTLNTVSFHGFAISYTPGF